jgi:uncharacterized protein YjbI with pentapeptide repeats
MFLRTDLRFKAIGGSLHPACPLNGFADNLCRPFPWRDSRSPRPDHEGLTAVANEEHIRRLKEGVDAWNAWRREEGTPGRPLLIDANLIAANLKGANLMAANLKGANLKGANLNDANLNDANLDGADLHGANLHGADLHGANLNDANLYLSDLHDTKLIAARLTSAKLTRANLSGANLNDATFGETIFADLDLTGVVALETCHHSGSSVIDHRTLQKSRSLPIPFLRGLGLPQVMIDYLPTLLNQAIQYYSCFISYSTGDQEFADRIHADLQNKGVRCWFAPHDMPIGAKILDEIDTAIRLREKLLLILSEHSIESDWVEDEVAKAFEEERKRKQIALLPIRIDNAVIDTNEAWAAKLRARNIGDFTCWKEHGAYQKSFERVLRDLAPKPNDKG